MSAVDPAAATTSSSRKGFWSSNNNPSVNPAGAVVATDPNGGRLQATKASLKKLNFFRRNKAGRQPIGDYNQGSSLVENRHITISHPIPAFENSPGNLQHGDALEELHEDLTTTPQTFDAPPPLGAIPTKTIPLTWEPLPLFKVYSRSIKYSTLPAPCLSAETILRNNAQRPRAGSLGETTCANTESHDEESTKNKKGKRKSLRSMDSLNKAGWTRKIYILETKGHMLQYGIEGPFDRLPEKVLKLGPNTAAFASDAIPGKHWVIQISNRVDDDVSKSTTDPKKHFFTRLGHDYRREEQKSILMVLNGPEEMESWLTSVRKEIQKHGGKEYISEDTTRQKHTSAVPSREGVEGPLSRRTTAMVDENSLSRSRNPSSKRNSGNMAETLVQNRRSLPPRESVDAPSLATNGTDGDRLHDKSRFSYASMGARSASSASTSPCPSPGIAGDDQERTECPLSEFQIAYNRLSNYTSSETDPLQELSRRQTVSPPPAAPVPSRKPTPNFSMPIFSKRYSSQTSRTSMMPRSTSSSSQLSNGGAVAHQNQERRRGMPLKEPTARPMRQRAVSTSVTESRSDAPQLLYPPGFKEHPTPKRYSSGLNDGRNNIKSNGRYSLDCREQKASAPELNSFQGYKLYNKPHPHIPETLDEDPMNRPKTTNQESWPIPNNDFLGIPPNQFRGRSKQSARVSEVFVRYLQARELGST
ncbi:Translocation protein S62 [Ascosphaera pollenicola]|nr:Translocation protein S62 [Ascosphaera pollenicola]